VTCALSPVLFPHTFFNASSTLSGVIGNLYNLAPVASKIAFAITAPIDLIEG
jgi:hypothetical protein